MTAKCFYLTLFYQFLALIPAFSVPESAPIGHVVGYISGKPELSTEPLYFVVFPDEETNKFIKVDEASGEISTIATLDYEERSHFEILIVPVAGGEPQQLAIEVEDENDNAPKFAEESITLEISEFAQVGISYTLPDLIDGDGPDFGVKRINILQGNVNNVFKISTRNVNNQLRAELTVNGQLDREYRDKYELLIEAEDGGRPPRVGRLKVQIRILDANDNSPIFSKARYAVTVPANVSIGSVLVTVSATDADLGLNAEVHYSIKKTTTASDSVFDVTSSGNLVSKELLIPSTVYDVIVEASDSGSPPLSSTAVVTVTVQGEEVEKAPIDVIWMSDTTSPHLMENSTLGSIVARISLSEAFRHGKLELAGCPPLCLQQTDTAHVYLILLCGLLDRETTPEYNARFLVKRKDETILEHPMLLTVGDVNDNAPLWPSSRMHIELNRTLGVSGRSFSAKDADSGRNGRIRYTVTDSDYVTVHPETGRIRVEKEIDCSITELKFTVRATDFGTPELFSEVSVTAELVDQNSTPPIFTKPLFEVEMAENTSVGTCLVKIEARSGSCGSGGKVRYSLTTNDVLSIDTVTGTVCLLKELDYEKSQRYQTSVIAKNNGMTSTALISIKVTDVNDNWPIFYPSSYNLTVREGDFNEDPLVVVTAVDADSGVMGDVSYSITSDTSSFSINQSSGEIFAKKSLNRGRYHLIISAKDGMGIKSEHPAHVHVMVIGLDAKSPSFTQSRYEIRTSEDILPGIVIGSVAAMADGKIKYSIYSGDPEHNFSIEEDTGKILVVKSLDADSEETVLLNIQGTVEEGGANQTQVVIHIEDHNDNSPEFPSPIAEVTVAENQPLNEPFYIVQAKDKDRQKNGQVKYTVLSVQPIHQINVNPNGGQVYISSPLDFETVRDYTVKIKAQDMGIPPRSNVMTLVVHVGDVNDNAPIFEKSEFVAQVVENSPSMTEIGRFVATDADMTENGAVTYRITNGTEYFGVDEKTGVVYTKRPFDRESTPFIDLTMVAEDKGKPPMSSSVKIRVNVADVNDNAPVCSSINTLVVPFGGPNDVGTIVATDPDAGANGTILYRAQIQHDLFLVKANGEVTLRRPLTLQDPEDYRLTVIASDQGTPRKSSVCHVPMRVSRGHPDITIPDSFPRLLHLDPDCRFKCHLHAFDVKNVSKWQVQSSEISNHFDLQNGVLTMTSSPPFRPPYSITIIMMDAQGRQVAVNVKIVGNQTVLPISLPESLSIGAKIGTVGETRKESFYRLLTDDCPFALDQSSGALYLERKLQNTTYTCGFTRVNPIEGTEEPFEVEYEVSKRRDEKPKVEKPHVEVNMKEDALPGTIITTINATAAKPINFRLKMDSDNLMIDEFTGDVTLVNPVKWHESPTLHAQIEVYTTGAFSKVLLTVIVEDVNDNPPEILSPAELWLPSSARRGAIVHRVIARDIDSNDIKFECSNNHFTINDQGEIILDDVISGDLDELKVKAIDASDPSMYAEQILTIRRLQKKNDKWQYFDEERYSIRVSEGTPEDTVVYSFDGHLPLRMFPENGQFRLRASNVVVASKTLQSAKYTILVESENEQVDWTTLTIDVDKKGDPPRISSASCGMIVVEESTPLTAFKRIIATGDGMFKLQGPAHPFLIDPVSGVLSAKPLDREETQEHLLVVLVEGKSGNDSCTVRVIVQDLNDNAPQFSFSTPQEIELTNDTKTGDVIYRFIATDLDVGQNGKISFNLIEDESGLLDLRPDSGELILKRTNSAPKSDWMIKVAAADHGSPTPQATEMFVRIRAGSAHLGSAHDPPTLPQFLREVYVVDVDEGQARGQFVAKMSAIGSENSPITYSIVEGNIDSAFSIDNEGVLRTAQELDREIVDRYDLRVLGMTASENFDTKVRIGVNNLNDNPPFFPVTRQRKVSEGLPIGSYVATVTANDVDSLSPLRYRLLTENVTFHIDSYTGVIHLVEPLDYEDKNNYEVTIEATDGQHKVTTTMNIQILDVNDNKPIFAKDYYDLKVVRSHLSLHQPVVKLSASDIDSEPNSKIKFSLKDDQGIFNIDENDGSINFAHLPSSNGHYIVIAAASDSGMPSLTSTVPVRVTVVDEQTFDLPTFKRQLFEFYVLEDAARGTTIGNVTVDAVDQIYRITDKQSAEKFSIDRFGRVQLVSELDREEKSSYTFSVELDTDTVKKSTTTVKVKIGDVNDNYPKFDRLQTIYLKDSLLNGQVLTSLAAADPDEGENGRLSYSILAGDDYGIFSLDSSTGSLLFNRWHDAQLEEFPDATWNVLVEARDHGSPARVTVTNVPIAIKLSTWSGTAPFFIMSSYEIHVLENVHPGTVIGRPCASNRYSIPNKGLLYSLRDAGEKFTIDPASGELRLKSVLDWETMTKYSMFVSVSDGRGRSAVVPLNVIVEPVDEYAPVFLRQIYMLQVSTGTELGTIVGKVSAHDQDGGEHGKVRYIIADGILAIDEVTGELILREKLKPRGNVTVEKLQVVAESSRFKKSSVLVQVEIGDFSADNTLNMLLRIPAVQLGLTAGLLLLLLLLCLVIYYSCISRKQKSTKPPLPQPTQVHHVEKPQTLKRQVYSVTNGRIQDEKAISMSSSASTSSDAARFARDSTRSHVDSGIDPDNVSVNSSVTEYLMSIGVNPVVKHRQQPTYDTLNSSVLNDYIYAKVEDVIPPKSMTRQLTPSSSMQLNPSRLKTPPNYQPLTRIFQDIVEKQEEEANTKRREYVQVEI